jgi:hypothetical protein
MLGQPHLMRPGFVRCPVARSGGRPTDSDSCLKERIQAPREISERCRAARLEHRAGDKSAVVVVAKRTRSPAGSANAPGQVGLFPDTSGGSRQGNASELAIGI